MAARFLASILFLITAASISPPATSVHCDAADKTTLLKIKSELGHPDPLLSSWNPATDCCSWEGIMCEMSTGQTLGLNLTNAAAISAPIPPSIGRLPVLQYLTFSNIPSLTGPIPTSLAKHPHLMQLTIAQTALAGPIPSFLGSMPQLGSLDLSHNRLSGPIPKLPGGMYYSIDLSHNMLSGPIPASLFAGSVSNPELYLSHNRLTGEIPRELGKVNFGTVDLSANGLTGDASFLFGARKWAVRIDLSWNALGFDISGVELSQYLERLDISHNRIWGRVPRSVAGLKRLVALDVSENRLCGRIPDGRRMGAFGVKSYAGNKCLCGKPLPACGIKAD